MPTISRILVPVDLSVCSRAAIDFAAVIGRQFGASIDVLNVWEPPRGVGPEFLIREPGEKGHPLLEDARALTMTSDSSSTPCGGTKRTRTVALPR